MEAMLLESAKLAVSIGQQYAKIKKDPAARYYTYVLQLQQGKFYVGNTDNIYTRLLDHFMMTKSSSKWVQHHGPVQRLVEVSKNSAKDDENYKTLQYMSMFGWENVRGSSYCRVQMYNPPETLAAFARHREHEFQYLTQHEIDAILEQVRQLQALAHPPI